MLKRNPHIPTALFYILTFYSQCKSELAVQLPGSHLRVSEAAVKSVSQEVSDIPCMLLATIASVWRLNRRHDNRAVTLALEPATASNLGTFESTPTAVVFCVGS